MQMNRIRRKVKLIKNRKGRLTILPIKIKINNHLRVMKTRMMMMKKTRMMIRIRTRMILIMENNNKVKKVNINKEIRIKIKNLNKINK
jgi:hypothetical protein